MQQKKMDLNVDVQTRMDNGKNREDVEEESLKTPSEHSSLVGLNDATDEFYDVSEPLDYDQSESGWQSDYGPEMYSQVLPVKVRIFGMTSKCFYHNKASSELTGV